MAYENRMMDSGVSGRDGFPIGKTHSCGGRFLYASRVTTKDGVFTNVDICDKCLHREPHVEVKPEPAPTPAPAAKAEEKPAETKPEAAK